MKFNKDEFHAKLLIVRYSDLPLAENTQALNSSSFDHNLTSRMPLPVLEVNNDFQASYSVLYNDGELFTFQATFNSTVTRCRCLCWFCTCCTDVVDVLIV